MAEPVTSKKTYFFAYLGLLALTLLTVLLAYIRMGPFSMMIGIFIAAIQASLIAAFFMHALFESALVRVVAAGGIVWFLIMTTLVITDYITRGWLPFPGK